jgi:hypothetical protein
VDTWAAADLPGLQVKTSQRMDARLLVPRDAVDGERYVLVVGVSPRYRICGWIDARDAKREQWLTDPSGQGRPPVYAVPQDALHPMDL